MRPTHNRRDLSGGVLAVGDTDSPMAGSTDLDHRPLGECRACRPSTAGGPADEAIVWASVVAMSVFTVLAYAAYK